MYRDHHYTISLHKKLDYSAPIIFVPCGTSLQTTHTKNSTNKTSSPKPKIMQTKTLTNALNKVVNIQKPTTIANVEQKKIVEPLPITHNKQNSNTTNTELKKEIPKKPVVAKTPIAQALDIQQTIKQIIPKDAQISYNYREAEALRCNAQLQKELVQQWKPPFGVSAECSCDISFFVNKRGVIENLKITKASGVMMYDISARQALFSMKMPPWTYGKSIIINFKQ